MKISSYQQAKEYIEHFITPGMYEKITVGSQDANDPLARMKYFLSLLGNPQDSFQSVVVSGTSGKGSTSLLISEMLVKAGYSVGLTQSPHLQKMNERIVVNGLPITDADFLRVVKEVGETAEKMISQIYGSPSYFEFLLACAFVYFAKRKVEIVVAEVGLEGRYDGTQVLSPLVFTYTNTSLDHTTILGKTIESIAKEGASAIKPSEERGTVPSVVTGVSQEAAKKNFARKAHEVGSPIFFLHRDFSYHLHTQTTEGVSFDFSFGTKTLKNLFVNLAGDYQAENAALAIATILQLKNSGFVVSDENIREALSHACLPGRFEKILLEEEGKTLEVILDGAHNKAKMRSFVTALQHLYPRRKKIVVVDFKEGKAVTTLLRILLPIADMVIATEYHVASDMTKNTAMKGTAVFSEIQKSPYKKQSAQLFYTPSTKNALKQARKLASEHGALIVVTGSLYLVGEVRELLFPSH